jgi:hypothetical protein
LCAYSRRSCRDAHRGWPASFEDRENVILFATVLEVVREVYVDREATDTEK